MKKYFMLIGVIISICFQTFASNDIIEKTAKKVGNYTYTTKSDRKNGTWNQYMGYGLLDATAAVKAAQATLK